MKISFLTNSAVATSYSKGDRVAYKMDKNEWYIGTVSRVFTGNIAIIFDDGGKFTTEPSSKLKKVDYRKRISAMTDAQVKEIIVTEINTRTTTRTKEPASRLQVASRVPVKPKATASRAELSVLCSKIAAGLVTKFKYKKVFDNQSKASWSYVSASKKSLAQVVDAISGSASGSYMNAITVTFLEEESFYMYYYDVQFGEINFSNTGNASVSLEFE